MTNFDPNAAPPPEDDKSLADLLAESFELRCDIQRIQRSVQLGQKRLDVLRKIVASQQAEADG